MLMPRGDERLRSFFVILRAELSRVKTENEIKTFAISRLSERCRKKAEFRQGPSSRDAINSFLLTNELVRNTSIDLPCDVIQHARVFIAQALENFTSSRSPDSRQDSLDLDVLFDLWRFGPGASNGTRATHTVDKISEVMTCTRSAYPLVRELRRRNPYFQAFDSRNGNRGVRLVGGSRLEQVPKNEDTLRNIAIEPSGNMALQLAAGSYIEGALRGVGFDITTQQDANKFLAWAGSRYGEFCTLDLKSASDMISPKLIAALWPPEWFALLMTIRSHRIEVNGSMVSLNMISTMGNGFTFPMMTLTLLSLIAGMRRSTTHVSTSSAAVFGDDIIVKTSEYEPMVYLLERAGLVVNHNKSYVVGDFRESCGGDYYRGVDVTPFYAKSLATNADIYVVINQVLDWAARHDVSLHETLSFLRCCLRGTPFFVPEWSAHTEGVRTSQVKKRYKTLVPRREVVRMDLKHPSNFFLFSLAAGSYVTSFGAHVEYMPRPRERVRYDVRECRLPKGFLHGGDIRSYTPSESAGRDLLISFALR